jgi:SAM-dependent methyltransferase
MVKMKSRLSYIGSRLLGLLRPSFRLIVDRERSLGDFTNTKVGYDTTLAKEALSRRYVFAQDGEGLNFLDVGARDGQLTYLLGIERNLQFDEQLYCKNLAMFQAKYNYFGMDLLPASDEQVLSGDACDSAYVDRNPQFRNKFDVIYSNNVFEHFERPWIAADNLVQLLKLGGIVITIVPFAQRYHESPGDYFRYTHKGVESLFMAAGRFEVLESGYDISGRRNNWQGSGQGNDAVPTDHFGAWRETWFTVSVLRKLQESQSREI